MKKDYDIRYPSYIARLGTWPLNFGLFFLYDTIVNLGLSLLAAAFYTARGITDPNIVVEKTQGLAIIGLLLTLGITLIFTNKFYVHKVRKAADHDEHASDANVPKDEKEGGDDADMTDSLMK